MTLKDVALHVGVSSITVSRALSKPDQVSQTVLESVQNAVRQLGYIPNRSARRLASAQSHIVGLIIPSLTNIVFADVVHAIDQVLKPENYQVLIGNTQYSPVEEEQLISTFLGYSPDSMIVTGTDQTDYARQLLVNADIPIVQIMASGKETIDMSVGFSHYQAGYDITQHLINKGKKRIGFMGAQMDPRTQSRLQGFKKAVEDAGLTDNSVMSTTVAPSTVKLGGELLLDMLTRDNKLDAIFCCNDDLAMGAIFECQRSNIKIPDQLSISGFNDLEPSKSINPPLTTVATPRYEIGQYAAQLLLKSMTNETIEEDKKNIDLGYKIIERGSS